MAIKGLTPGRMVRYVIPDGSDSRPAVVVRVFDKEKGYVLLDVFAARPDDDTWTEGRLIVDEKCYYSEEEKPETWHFPKFVE